MSSDTREFDIVVFGATGFTGRLVAEHLAAHGKPGSRIALAGRRSDVLTALRERLMAAHPQRVAIGTIVADVRDAASLALMASRTRTVLSTVGPFGDYGEPVVGACVAQGADYLDSSGEHAFVRSMIARYDAAARERGVRLIFSCAFESVPTDLGVYFTRQLLPQGKPVEIAGHLSFRGDFSGGTQRSAIKDAASTRPGAEEYSYVRAGRSGRLLPGRIHRARAVEAWVTAYDAIDPHVVLRSAAALECYGPDFTYTHLLVYPSLAALVAFSSMFGTMAFLARAAPLRALMLKLAKPAGEGPTDAQMARGWFRIRFAARCEAERVVTEVSGGDPGYGATSMMLGQCALCLNEDGAALPRCSGAVTPAQAFGGALIPRLQAHGMQFRVLTQGV